MSRSGKSALLMTKQFAFKKGIGHGLHGIKDQVEKTLLQLISISIDD